MSSRIPEEGGREQQGGSPFDPPRDSSTRGGEPTSGYGHPAGQGEQPAYGAQPGYGEQQGYGGPPPGYGDQQGYGAPPGYGGQPGYGGPPPGYADSPGYGAPSYGGSGYGQPPYGQPQRPARNGMGIAALVLGILALFGSIFVLPALLGVVAVILGFLGRGRAKRGEATNGGMSLAGIITGALSVVIAGLLLVAGLSFLFNTDTGKQYQDCLRRAGGNQQAVQACQQQFLQGR